MNLESEKKPRSIKRKRSTTKSSDKQPRCALERDAMRKHVDVMEAKKTCAETIMRSCVAHYQRWSRQIDERYGCRLFDKHLSAVQNRRRLAEYTQLLQDLNDWMAESVEQASHCYSANPDDMGLLTEMTIGAMKASMGDEGIGAVREPANADSEDPRFNQTLMLLCASLAEKAITYKMPHPDLNIPGVPDKDEQEEPIPHVRKKLGEVLADSPKKIGQNLTSRRTEQEI